MKKAIIISSIILWLFCGWYGDALVEGYFWGKYGPTEKGPVRYRMGQTVTWALGPIALGGVALFLANDPEGWKYGLRYDYWHHPNRFKNQP